MSNSSYKFTNEAQKAVSVVSIFSNTEGLPIRKF